MEALHIWTYFLLFLSVWQNLVVFLGYGVRIQGQNWRSSSYWLLIWFSCWPWCFMVHLLVFFILLVYMQILSNCVNEFYLTKYFQKYKSFRLHGVSKENPLAPLISRLGLPLYRTSGDNSVLYDHDLERWETFIQGTSLWFYMVVRTC